ncbi:MAG: sigma 54-interacting transcriptional regulator [Bdellovibrionales bacterium]|nr:sigma 54-interacting transcriptional regulator [Bdellovibrionales bacterium]
MLTQKIRIQESTQNYGFLRWSENSHTEQREITSFISIGRDTENIIRLDDQCASRRHCRIQKKENEGFILQDMNSRNGTFLNNNRVFKALLKNNDRIQIGNREFIFSFERFDNHWHIHTKSKNPHWNQQLENLSNIAKSNMPVLITGPSGTGKEMLAKLIHRYSHRSKRPMISINCSALSESLIESEFFGHIKGSYTGALNSRKGAFVAANGGSLFLDEIGDLPLHLQPKLLRALEYQEIKAVGSDHVTKTDVRIIAATHQDLAEKVAQNTFRSDLYFRLHVLSLSPPHLRDRMEDFDDLLHFFCNEYNISFSPKAISLLKQHPWPGNIRELKNTVARAKALFSGTIIETNKIKQLLYTPILTMEKQTEAFKELQMPVIKKIEKDLIIKAMTLHRGNQKKVAEELKLPQSTLSERIKKYDINPAEYKN